MSGGGEGVCVVLGRVMRNGLTENATFDPLEKMQKRVMRVSEVRTKLRCKKWH